MSEQDSFNGTCPAFDEIVPDAINPFAPNYTIPPFHNTRSIISAHQRTPRFGHTNDIMMLLNGSKEENKEYVMGLLAAAIGILAFVIVWLLVVLIMKWIGHKRVGFFSGQRFRRPKPPPTEPTTEMEEPTVQVGTLDEKDGDKKEGEGMFKSVAHSVGAVIGSLDPKEQDELKRFKRRQRAVRIVVLISGLFIVVCCIIFCTKGIKSLNGAFENGRAGLQKGESLALQAAGIIDEFVGNQTAVLNSSSVQLEKINEFCPKIAKQLCKYVDGKTSCNLTGVPFENEINTVLKFYDDIEQIVYKKLNGGREDLEELAELLRYLNRKAGQFNWAFWIAAGFAIAIGILCLFLMYGVVLAWIGKLQGSCFRLLRNGLVVPLFIFFVLMSLVFTCVFVIGSATAADLCFDSPDDRLTQAMINRKDKFGDSPVYHFALYYISGCPLMTLPMNSEKVLQGLLKFFGTISSLLQIVSEYSQEAFQEACGVDENVLTAATTTLQKELCLLTVSLLKVRNFFSCFNWRPLYQIVAYDAVCYNATSGMEWLASTQFLIVFFSMIIVTLRSACYEVDEEEELASQKRCCSAFVSTVCPCWCRKGARAVNKGDSLELEDGPLTQQKGFYEIDDAPAVDATIFYSAEESVNEHSALAGQGSNEIAAVPSLDATIYHSAEESTN